jgi:hypothetical protein
VKSIPQLPEIPGFSWASFVCAGCGRRVEYGVDLGVDAAMQQFAFEMLFGDPPVCTECQNEARL